MAYEAVAIRYDLEECDFTAQHISIDSDDDDN